MARVMTLRSDVAMVSQSPRGSTFERRGCVCRGACCSSRMAGAARARLRSSYRTRARRCLSTSRALPAASLLRQFPDLFRLPISPLSSSSSRCIGFSAPNSDEARLRDSQLRSSVRLLPRAIRRRDCAARRTQGSALASMCRHLPCAPPHTNLDAPSSTPWKSSRSRRSLAELPSSWNLRFARKIAGIATRVLS